jgi:clan AA aspartic protease
MIAGEVKSNEGHVRVRVKGPKGNEKILDAVVDTGYSGILTLPPTLIRELGLRYRSIDHAVLADGSVCEFKVYVGSIEWDGKMRRALIDEADTDSLLGMKLMKGHELKMHVRYGGKVTIRRLRKRT